MRITGNRGEWSEFYVFVKLLSEGKLYAADENLERIEGVFFPIIKIFRHEDKGVNLEYVITSDDSSVEVKWNTEIIRNLPQRALLRMAKYLYDHINSEHAESGAFGITDSDRLMDELATSHITAPSTDKTDITLQLYDIHTGYSPVVGFSIKSNLGGPPTLLNASRATNFAYSVNNLSLDDIERINAINDKKGKLFKRVAAIRSKGELKFSNVQNTTFESNLMMIDTYMGDIVGELILESYLQNKSELKALLNTLEERNPLGFSRRGLYIYKVKKLLYAAALGMMPAKIWDGHDEANGGCIVVKTDGDVVAYHLYNKNTFEEYLLNNTKLEHASTTRHKYGEIYPGSDGNYYIDLNLQIRFI